MALSTPKLPDDLLRLVIEGLDFETLKVFSLCSRRARALSVGRPTYPFEHIKLRFYLTAKAPRLLRCVALPGLSPEHQASLLSGLSVENYYLVRRLIIKNRDEDILRLPATLFYQLPNLRALDICSRFLVVISSEASPDVSLPRSSGGAWTALENLHELSFASCLLSSIDVLQILKLPSLKRLSFSHTAGIPASKAARGWDTILEELEQHEASSVTELALDNRDDLLPETIMPLLANVQWLKFVGFPSANFLQAIQANFTMLHHLDIEAILIPDLLGSVSDFASRIAHLTIRLLLSSQSEVEWLEHPEECAEVLAPADNLRRLNFFLPRLPATLYTQTLRHLRTVRPEVTITRHVGSSEDALSLIELEGLGISVEIVENRPKPQRPFQASFDTFWT